MHFYKFEEESEQFPLYQQYDNLLTLDEIKNLSQALKFEEIEFKKSLVFNNDPKLFDFIEELIIKKINNSGTENIKFILDRNGIEILKYENEDFSEKKQNFVKFYSNIIKSYSLIICLKGDSISGFTKVYLSEDKILEMHQTCTPGSSILFRDEIFHQRTKVNDGIQLILKLNILGIFNRTNIKNINDILQIKFENDERFYLLPFEIVSKFPKSYFFAEFHFKKTNNIIIKNYTFEQFKIIYDCLIGSFDLMEYDNNREIIDYFGIDTNILDIMDNFKNEYLLKVDKMNDFINNKNPIMIADNLEEYLKYKNYFKNNNNIIPFQSFEKICCDGKDFMNKINYNEILDTELYWLNILEGIPIFFNNVSDQKYMDTLNWLQLVNSENDQVINSSENNIEPDELGEEWDSMKITYIEKNQPQSHLKKKILENLFNFTNLSAREVKQVNNYINAMIISNDIQFSNRLIEIFYNWHCKKNNRNFRYDFTHRKKKNIADPELNIEYLNNIIEQLKKYKILDKLYKMEKKYSYNDFSVCRRDDKYDSAMSIYLFFGFINLKALE